MYFVLLLTPFVNKILTRSRTVFFRKEAYYLEENAKIFVLTNSFIHPCQCLHKMMNEIPLNILEI